MTEHVSPINLQTLPPLGSPQPIPPARFLRDGQPASLPIVLSPGSSLLMDWGRKRTGSVAVSGSGPVRYALASDLQILELFDQHPVDDPGFVGDKAPSFTAFPARGEWELSPEMRQRTPTHLSSAFRYVRLSNTSRKPVRVDGCELIPSEFPAQPEGWFECSDPELNRAWRMAVDTVHLCTQPASHSLWPVFAPFGKGYVQWDGCRRDREVWGGDLRPGSLCWLYNWTDPEPILNSLILIMSAQHMGCSEHGLYPGSASTHQPFYEWAFWECVCLYETWIHTGDERLLRFAKTSLPWFLEWCERRFAEHPDGWLHCSLSWMYTIPLDNVPLPALQATAAMGLQAMAQLFRANDHPDHAERTHRLWQSVRDRFNAAFWSDTLQAYRFLPNTADGVDRSDLATNAWAILAGLAPSERQSALLASLQRHRTPFGNINIAPVLGIDSCHDGVVWPYACAYESAARFHVGDSEGALELIRRVTGGIASIGHHTLFEAIHPDGSLPITASNGNTLSFCHAWAGQIAWQLQRYVLGLYPTAPGWSDYRCEPADAGLQWARGRVCTPRGILTVDVERGTDGMHATVR